MDDLPAFLNARLGEREDAANAMLTIYPTPWDVSDRGWMARVVADGPNFPEVIRLEQNQAPHASWLGDWIQHVVLNNPDVVLADVAAKRQIIAEHEPDASTNLCRRCQWDDDERDDPDKGDGMRWVHSPCPTLRLLALPDAGHPDYREEWKP